jgi:hypothetical protein
MEWNICRINCCILNGNSLQVIFTEEGDNFRNIVRPRELQSGGYIASVGVLSARRVSARLRGVHAASAAMASGRMLRLQIVGTTCFVFVAFVVRSVFSTMFAVANHLRDNGEVCPGASKCSDCYNAYTHITRWMVFTPEFQLAIVLVSSPLALLVALWGMTKGHAATYEFECILLPRQSAADSQPRS